MDSYVKRLISCGYTQAQAMEVKEDILRNFDLAELETYVRHVEAHHVDKIQS